MDHARKSSLLLEIETICKRIRQVIKAFFKNVVI